MASSSRGDDMHVPSREAATGGTKCRVPFSIDAILNSPHPAKPSGCVLRERRALAARRSRGVGALSSLERFTKNSLRSQQTEESKDDGESPCALLSLHICHVVGFIHLQPIGSTSCAQVVIFPTRDLDIFSGFNPEYRRVFVMIKTPRL